MDSKKIVAAVMASRTLEQAAATLGVSYTSLYRMLKKEPTRTLLAEARQGLLDSVLQNLQGAMSEAVLVLRWVIRNEALAPGVRVRAAIGLLDCGLKAVNLLEIERRLAELEKQIELKGK